MATLNKIQVDFKLLTKSTCFLDASTAKHRLIMINHVGTLSTNRKDLPSVVRTLNMLSEQEGFSVVLISPSSRAELAETLGRACPKLILVAENGFFAKLPEEEEWEDIVPVGDISWHEAVIGIM